MKKWWMLGLLLGGLIQLTGGSVLATTDVQHNIEQASTQEVIQTELPAVGKQRTIYGYLTAPQNYQELKLPTIVLAHGFGGRAESLAFYAEAFAKQGYVVYSFDFMGGNPQSRSGQDTLAMSVFTEQEDLEIVLDMLAKQSFVNSNYIFLMGQSQGGVVATMVAAAHPEQVRGLLLLYPAYVLFDDARELFSSVEEIPAIYNHRGNNVGKVYFEKSLAYDIYRTMAHYQGPVAIAYGTQDEIEPVSYAERAQQTFKQATLLKVEGAGHAFNQAQSQQALRLYLGLLAQEVAQ